MLLSPFSRRLDGIHQCAPRHIKAIVYRATTYRRDKRIKIEPATSRLDMSYLNPAFSRAWTPAMVVPPGEHTLIDNLLEEDEEKC